MATDLDDSFMSGDPIDPQHIKQLMAPLQDLEEGKAFYRDDVGVADAYQVDFSAASGNQNEISSYSKGLLIVFKAANANTGASTLTVVGPAGSLASKPIVKPGNVALGANDIKANQMVAVVYNDAGTGRFEMIGAPGGNVSASDITSGTLGVARGGTGADLSGTGGTGKYLKQTTSGGAVSVGDIAASDIASGTLPVGRGGTGQSSYSKGDLLVSDGGSSLVKLPVGTDGQLLTADSGASEGVSWQDAPTSGGGGGSSDLLFGDGSDGNVTITTDQNFYEHRFYNNLTITNGATLYMHGCKLYVNDTLTLDDGNIDCSGGDADASSGGTVGSVGNGNGGTIAWDSPGGSYGSIEQGESQNDWDAAVYATRGGAGGEGAYGSGGSGESNNTIASVRQFKSLPALLAGMWDGNTHYAGAHMMRFVRGGLGGGGGSGDGSSVAGGSGGGGGGVLWIAARHLSDGSSGGTLRARGGNGGDAGGTDAGGGGGGGGGVIFLLTSDDYTGFSIDVEGGYGGYGGGGSGLDGEDGEYGLFIFRGNL